VDTRGWPSRAGRWFPGISFASPGFSFFLFIQREKGVDVRGGQLHTVYFSYAKKISCLKNKNKLVTVSVLYIKK
jgi:hypothetical protein